MRRAKSSICVVALVVSFAPLARGEENAHPEGLHKLSVLYAGYPGDPREKAWLEFLKASFEKVESIDLRKLNAGAAADFDVVVADWTSRYRDGSYNSDAPRHGTSLGKDFTKPIIMISAVASEISPNLKIDWL